MLYEIEVPTIYAIRDFEGVLIGLFNDWALSLGAEVEANIRKSIIKSIVTNTEEQPNTTIFEFTAELRTGMLYRGYMAFNQFGQSRMADTPDDALNQIGPGDLDN